MAEKPENYIQVHHVSTGRYSVKYCCMMDSISMRVVADCSTLSKDDAMLIAEALANQYKVDIRYKPLVTHEDSEGV